jgi:carboxyl-terminal processing protease
MLKRTFPFRLAVLLSIAFLCWVVAAGQTLSKSDREGGKIMLHNIRDSIKKNYYDAEFHGVDIDEAFKASEASMDQATSNGQLFGIIEKALLSLKDTHTFFLPPPHVMRVSYDWQIQMIGDHCYIVAVKPGTDAEKQGLKPGDILHVVDGYKITRDNFWNFNYLYNALQPQQQLNVVVQGPGEQPRRVIYKPTTRQGSKILDLTSAIESGDYIREQQDIDRLYEHQFRPFGHELMIWKMPSFDMTVGRVNEIMDRVGKYKTLVIDLRGNAGGYVETLLQVVGNLFEHDTKIGDRKKRKDIKAMIAKTRGHDTYDGQLILLVDNGSASAAELLARVVQIEKKGLVIGDLTAGAVMESRRFQFSLGEGNLVFYGASITDADIIMTDGKSLEHVGVTPDKLMLPTGADMREQADPVLSYAASLAGVKLDPKEAGALFPVRWKPHP